MSNATRQVIVFLTVGASCALLYFGGFWLLFDVLGIPLYLSFTVAYGFALLVHFTVNRYWTFAATRGGAFSQLRRYVGLLLINYVLTFIVGMVAIRLLNVSPYIGTGAAILLTVCLNFVLARSWVFAMPEEIHFGNNKAR